MTWIGHKDSEMVRHYYRLQDPVSRQAMARLSEATETRRGFPYPHKTDTNGDSGEVGAETKTA